MNKTSLFLLIAFIAGFVFFQPLAASGIDLRPLIARDSLILADSVSLEPTVDTAYTAPIKKKISTDPQKRKRLVCSLFAFPFPCGFVGAHRVMLGTSPWVPVVYVATFGGCFGLLPLIDFCFITFSKDISPFENNPHIFMWTK